MEIFVVGLVIGATLIYLGRRAYKKYFRKSGDGCGGCGTCPSSRASQE